MSDVEKKEGETLGSFYMGRGRNLPQPKRYFPQGMLTAAALLAFAGIIWYAYPRGAEKYSDLDIPVVKADPSPIKVAPVDPGGMEVPYQDSTVFDQFKKGASGEVEQLLPAPEEPMDKELAIESTGDAEKPVFEAAKVAAPAIEPPQEAVQEAEPVKEASKPVSPVAASGGQIYIQLGSYREIKGAGADWGKLQKKYPELLGKLTMRTEKADLPAKGIYYRLQAGTLSEERAREICDVLKKAGSGGCILVKEQK